MPKQFPVEFRQRALRLLAEARQYQQYETEWAAIQAVSSRLGVNSETLRKWLPTFRGRRWHPARDYIRGAGGDPSAEEGERRAAPHQ
jgi:transposase-like protein